MFDREGGTLPSAVKELPDIVPFVPRRCGYSRRPDVLYSYVTLSSPPEGTVHYLHFRSSPSP